MESMIVTLIGAGNMARGIASRSLAGGHTVRLIDRSHKKAIDLADELRKSTPATPGAEVHASDAIGVEDADVVVLALPYPAGRDIVAEYGTALTGSVLIDICNPVDFSTLDSMVVPPGTSAAEQIAAEAAPGAPVVKAFNTTLAGTLLNGRVAGHPLDVFIAGDDGESKLTVAELVSSGAMRPLDVGPLRRARELEALGFLNITIQQPLGLNWSSAIKILT
jgi:8-hydroxy-5-deazaflavin:NADPH oxidoreductase